MSKIQTLTLEGVKAAARRYYRMGKLTAQHRDQEKRECCYQVGRSYRCAIGAGLNPTTLAVIKQRELCSSTSVVYLLGLGVIQLKDNSSYNRHQLSVIQAAHDKWACNSRSFGSNYPATIQSRNQFLLLIFR